MAQYMYTMHTYGYRFIILPNSCFARAQTTVMSFGVPIFLENFTNGIGLKQEFLLLIALESETQVEVRAWLVPSGGFGYELALKSLS